MAALAENPGSIPSTHKAAHNSSPTASADLRGHEAYTAHLQTGKPNTRTYKTKTKHLFAELSAKRSAVVLWWYQATDPVPTPSSVLMPSFHAASPHPLHPVSHRCVHTSPSLWNLSSSFNSPHLTWAFGISALCPSTTVHETIRWTVIEHRECE